MENYVTDVDPDESYDQTPDNIDQDEGMMTNAGDTARTVGSYNQMRQISGHVILNQAAVCTNRYGKPIESTQYDKHFIQRLVSTIKGQSFPLLYMEGVIFLRIFGQVQIMIPILFWALYH